MLKAVQSCILNSDDSDWITDHVSYVGQLSYFPSTSTPSTIDHKQDAVIQRCSVPEWDLPRTSSLTQTNLHIRSDTNGSRCSEVSWCHRFPWSGWTWRIADMQPEQIRDQCSLHSRARFSGFLDVFHDLNQSSNCKWIFFPHDRGWDAAEAEVLTRDRCQQLHPPFECNLANNYQSIFQSHKNASLPSTTTHAPAFLLICIYFFCSAAFLPAQHFSLFSQALSSLWAASSGSFPIPVAEITICHDAKFNRPFF